MRDLNLATAQFEARDRDKEYNLSRDESLTAEAVRQGAAAVSFHECCVTGYTHLMSLGKKELLDLAQSLEGQIRNSGRHPGGIVISSKPLLEVAPLYRDQRSKEVVVQFCGPFEKAYTLFLFSELKPACP